MTVEEWWRAWVALPGRSAETLAHRERMLESFIAEFAMRELEDVKPLECARWASRHPGGTRYLKTLLNDAVRMGVLEASPARGLRVKVNPPRHALKPAPALAHVLAAGQDREIGDMVLVAAFTGMRFGELARLEAQHVDGHRLTVFGKRTATNPSGERRCAVFSYGRAALERNVPEVGLVFPSPDGLPWHRLGFAPRWRRVWREHGVPGAWHSLRHFCGSWLLDQGASEHDVAAQLGHFDRWGRPDPRMVRRVYGRPDPEEAFSRLEGLAG